MIRCLCIMKCKGLRNKLYRSAICLEGLRKITRTSEHTFSSPNSNGLCTRNVSTAELSVLCAKNANSEELDAYAWNYLVFKIMEWEWTAIILQVLCLTVKISAPVWSTWCKNCTPSSLLELSNFVRSVFLTRLYSAAAVLQFTLKIREWIPDYYVVASAYIAVYLSMALQPSVGPWPLFQFLGLFTLSVGHLGRGISPSQGRYLHTGQHKHRIINTQRHPCLEWDWNPRSQRSSERRQFMP
jgi:hypothetical protein